MDYELHIGDCIESMKKMEDQSVHCCVTSPPYFGLRDYGMSGQIGMESSPEDFVAVLVRVFQEVRRVLRDDGTLWLNLGDSYATGGRGGGGSFMNERADGAWKGRSKVTGWRSAPPGLKHKDLIGIPWRVALALQSDGWYLRQDIIWHKPNPMPESVTDRCTKSHEYIFLLSKSPRYYYDYDAVKEDITSDRAPSRKAKKNGAGHLALRPNGSSYNGDGDKRNRRSVWTVTTRPYKGAHFATFPPALIEPCILAGCPIGGTVLDPFGGSGTTAGVAISLGRKAVLCELNPEYARLTKDRVDDIAGSSLRLAI